MAREGSPSFMPALGERDRVFACLEKSYEERDVFLAFLQILPEFRSLHDDPRFTDLLRRIALAAHTSGAIGGPPGPVI